MGKGRHDRRDVECLFRGRITPSRSLENYTARLRKKHTLPNLAGTRCPTEIPPSTPFPGTPHYRTPAETPCRPERRPLLPPEPIRSGVPASAFGSSESLSEQSVTCRESRRDPAPPPLEGGGAVPQAHRTVEGRIGRRLPSGGRRQRRRTGWSRRRPVTPDKGGGSIASAMSLAGSRDSRGGKQPATAAVAALKHSLPRAPSRPLTSTNTSTNRNYSCRDRLTSTWWKS